MGDPRDLIRFEPGEAEDPFDTISSARFENGEFVGSETTGLPENAYQAEPFDGEVVEEPGDPYLPEKLHPLLADWIANRDGEVIEPVLVTFIDDVEIPRFPSLNPDEPRDSDNNASAADRAREMMETIDRVRAERYEILVGELTDTYQANFLEHYWLVNAILAEMRLDQVARLVEREDVLYIEPQFGEEPPPAAQVDDGRAHIMNDLFATVVQSAGWIGLLDTGVRRSHTLLSGNHPNERPIIGLFLDCVKGGPSCSAGDGFNPDDDCGNHGTSSAAIICGNGSLGEPYRGLTNCTLDSFKVYTSHNSGARTCTAGLDHAAVLRGFQQAILARDSVIVAEMQGGGIGASAIALVADNAFNSGSVVVAANGNSGTGSTVRIPANAHKVIGVGSFYCESGFQDPQQLPGPAPDGRIKPDIQAPTRTETASNASDIATQVFGNTSGATPYAAGAAALLRNWLRGGSTSIDPGHVYARLILSGSRVAPFDKWIGAGRIRMTNDGLIWWGKVRIPMAPVGETPIVNIPLRIDIQGLDHLVGVVWWPETATQKHNHRSLELIPPGGASPAASSNDLVSVFQRARAEGPIRAGQWTLRVRGTNVRTSSQVVYWAAQVANQERN